MSLIVRQIQNEKDLVDIYKLRYKVFCLEWGFENPDNNSGRIVTDIYDRDAIHFAARDDSQKTVGAVMLILNSSDGFPLEKFCELEINPEELPRDGMAEISRLVIHRDYRRRAEDKYIYGLDEERRSIGSFHFQPHYPSHKAYHRRADDKFKYRHGAKRTGEFYGDRRRRHEVIIKLYKAIYQESKRRGLTHWYAVMTKGIVTLLNKFGFSFEAIGDPVDYHGIRTPYLSEIAKMEQDMGERTPDLYEEFTQNI